MSRELGMSPELGLSRELGVIHEKGVSWLWSRLHFQPSGLGVCICASRGRAVTTATLLCPQVLNPVLGTQGMGSGHDGDSVDKHRPVACGRSKKGATSPVWGTVTGTMMRFAKPE